MKAGKGCCSKAKQIYVIDEEKYMYTFWEGYGAPWDTISYITPLSSHIIAGDFSEFMFFIVIVIMIKSNQEAGPKFQTKHCLADWLAGCDALIVIVQLI